MVSHTSSGTFQSRAPPILRRTRLHVRSKHRTGGTHYVSRRKGCEEGWTWRSNLGRSRRCMKCMDRSVTATAVERNLDGTQLERESYFFIFNDNNNILRRTYTHVLPQQLYNVI